ncbi:hypothetical protein [Streptomyces sp. DASNCL29]|uniref:hypothetical protein n=1 Tax=Streptomyces sp. DASNCL29 TaxID=2583819 RepID=UPI00110FA66C|nr:hypothetical protein [Streptomyces sp. DASNCL29]TMU98082.1 hypothetical protein FGK60_09645 [Streptomyces sp. DASNCL29]
MITLAAEVGSMTSTTLTSAGLAVGIGLLAVEHVKWWRGGTAPAASGGKGKKGGGPVESAGKKRDPMKLVPFWFGIAFGTIAVACPAGLLGTGAGFLRWGGNSVGNLVMDKMTGQTSTAIASASAPRLDGSGALIVTALVITLFLLRKTFAKVLKGKFWWGVWAGTLLAIGTGTFAAIGNFVVPGVNDLGAYLVDGVVHGTLV